MADNSKKIDLIDVNRKTIQSSILVSDVFNEGTIVSINNRYVKVFKIVDINYELSDRKDLIEKAYQNVINSVDKNVEISIIYDSRKISKRFIEEKVMLENTGDSYDYLRDSINQNIKKNSSYQTITKDKYLVIAFTIDDKKLFIDDDIDTTNVNKTKKHKENSIINNKIYKKEEIIDKKTKEELKQEQERKRKERREKLKALVKNRMFLIGSAIKRNFESIENTRLKELTQDETLKLFYKLYNKDRVEDKLSTKEYDLISKKTIEDLEISVKDIISPSTLEFHKDFIKINNKYAIALHMTHINKNIETDTLDRLCENNFEVLIGLKERPIDPLTTNKLIEREISSVESEIYDLQTRLSEKKVSLDLVPQVIKIRREEAININKNLKTKNDCLFDMGLYVLVYGDSYKEVRENVYQFMNNGSILGIYFDISEELQENVFNTILPYGINQTFYTRVINSEGLLGFLPFNSMDLIEEEGVYYGKNLITNNPITYNVMEQDNYSMLIFGMTGKGKSVVGKTTLFSRVLRDKERQSIVIDNSDEYREIIESVGGQNIYIEAGGNDHINLFDIDKNYGDNPLADKEDLILTVCSEMLHKKLTAGQRTTVSIAVSMIYKEWLNDEKKIPTIHDFESALTYIVNSDNSNEEDKELLKAIRYYSSTSYCTLFRGNTNIDSNNRLINYNLKNLGKDLKPLAMQVILDNIWLKVCKNRYKKIPTDIIIDEFHLMFLDEDSASFVSKMWKMFRKYKGCPIGITQNPEDVLNSFYGRDVIANTGFLVSLSLLESDIKLLQKEIVLSDRETDYIRNKESGTGLIYVYSNKGRGTKVVVPFSNKYDENNIIFKMLDTKNQRSV